MDRRARAVVDCILQHPKKDVDTLVRILNRQYRLPGYYPWTDQIFHHSLTVARDYGYPIRCDRTYLIYQLCISDDEIYQYVSEFTGRATTTLRRAYKGTKNDTQMRAELGLILRVIQQTMFEKARKKVDELLSIM